MPDCLLINFSMQTSKKTSKVSITGPLWGESIMIAGFPSHKGVVMQEVLPLESIKTTSMEDVSTRVLENIKNI